MISIVSIPHNKVYRQKTYLNLEQDKLKGHLVILNADNLEMARQLITSPAFEKTKFTRYYSQPLLKGNLGMKMYNKNLRQSRVGEYKDIKSNAKQLNGILDINMVKDFNLYYSIHPQLSLFNQMTENVPKGRKITMFGSYIQSILEDDVCNLYKTKSILINVNFIVDKLALSITDKNYNLNLLQLVYSYLYRNLASFKKFGDINFIFIGGKNVIRINPTECDDSTFQEFKIALKQLSRSTKELHTDGAKTVRAEKVKDIINERFNAVGNISESIEELIENTVIDDDDNEKTPEQIANEVEERIEENDELMDAIEKQVQYINTGKPKELTARDKELREKQAQLKVGKRNLSDIMDRKLPEIEKVDVSNAITTSNKNMTEIRYPNFEKSYNENLYQKDILSIFTGLSEGSIPMYILDIEVEDTSDELNYKDTYTIKFEDANRVRHTIKVDLPKFVENKFMYLNGNKKMIVKQLIMKPISKTAPDVVQIVTNYNKMFVRLQGDKLSKPIEKLKKVLSSNTINGVSIKRGNFISINSSFVTAIEFDALAKEYHSIKTKTDTFIFSQSDLYSELEKISGKPFKLSSEDCMVVGIRGKEPIILSKDQTVKGTELSLVEFIIDSISKTSGSKFTEAMNNATTGKRFMYSKAKNMNRETPLIILLSFFEGISNILKKAEVAHYFTDKNPAKSLTSKQDYIRFSDGYLVYDSGKTENTLLMNGLTTINTSSYEYADLDGRDAYLDIFEDLFKTRNIGQYLLNTYESMIDPITKDVLAELGYPTDINGVLIFANGLLADSAYRQEIDMNLYRVRSNEIVAAMLYKSIADSYNIYRQTANNNNPKKMSIKQDAVLKQLLTSQIVEDYSILNPIVELEKSRAITPKGPSGLNVDRAYTEEKRSYDKSMLGLMAMSTSPDALCGVVRSMATEPRIKNARGYIDIHESLDELKDVNLFSPAEMLTPLGAASDDSSR